MITLHEVKNRRNKTVKSFESPDELMVEMGFTLDETRALLDAAARTPEGEIPKDEDLVTRKYFVTFDDHFLRDLGVAEIVRDHGRLEAGQVADVLGITEGRVRHQISNAMKKLQEGGKLREFAAELADLVNMRRGDPQVEIVENTKIEIRFD